MALTNMLAEQRQQIITEVARQLQCERRGRVEQEVYMVRRVIEDIRNKLICITGSIDFLGISLKDYMRYAERIVHAVGQNDENYEKFLQSGETLLSDRSRLASSPRLMMDVLRNYNRFIDLVGTQQYDMGALPATDLSEEISRAIEQISDKYKSHPRSLRIDAIGTNIKDRAVKAVKLSNILEQLVDNAAEAMLSDGIIEVTVGTRDLDESYNRERPHVVPGRYHFVQVTDQGKGMDEATRRMVAFPLFASDLTKGRGWGLTAVDVIATRLGGHMDIESKPNVGTNVTIYFPAYAPVPTATSLESTK